MEIKLKWRVEPKLTGSYSSFQYRGWPLAEYTDHRSLRVYIAYYISSERNQFNWKLIPNHLWGGLAKNLKEAKLAASMYISEHYDELRCTSRDLL